MATVMQRISGQAARGGVFCATGLLLAAAVGCSQQPAQAPPAESAADAVAVVPDAEPSAAQREKMVAAKDALFQQLSGRLAEVIGAEGPAAAIAVCQTEALEITRRVGEQQGLQIGRTGVRLRNDANQPPPWSQPLIAAATAEPTFVMLTNNHAAALLPIKLQPQCVVCHGSPSDIPDSIQTKLAELYPGDDATGFAPGELRGWFWIELPPDA